MGKLRTVEALAECVPHASHCFPHPASEALHLLGTRVWFHGKQFFHGLGGRAGFQADSKALHLLCILFLLLLFKDFFLRWTIFKISIELVTILLLVSCLSFLATRPSGSYLPDQGSNPRRLRWKVKSQALDRQGNPYFYSYDISSASNHSGGWGPLLCMDYTFDHHNIPTR